MAYDTPSVRMALYRGIRLGTELQTIIPGMTRLGGEEAVDIDADTIHMNILSPNMMFIWQVVVYLRGASGASTPQIGLQHAFLQELRSFLSAGLKLNDLVWIDDITKTTQVNMPATNVTGPQTAMVVTVDDVTALGITAGDYVWIGSEDENEGFFALVDAVGGGPPHTLTLNVPGSVTEGGIVFEEARRVKDNYDVYKITVGYHRCKYGGQSLPEVRENSQDDHRFSMVYEFKSDTAPIFTGAV